MDHRKSHEHGFTLIELITTMFVALILVGIGIPGFNTAIKNSRLAKSSNELVTSLHRARSEALKRGHEIRLCAGDGNCNSVNWEEGWIVFVDKNKDGLLDTDPDAGEDIIIEQGAQSKTTIRSNGSEPGSFAYNNRGKPLDNRTFTICDNRPDAGKEVVIARTGRVSSNENTSNNC